MTAQQAIYFLILQKHLNWGNKLKIEFNENMTGEQVEAAYSEVVENYEWAFQDEKEDVRCGELETDIDHDWSMNYESKSVAAKLPNGLWVGWTYWYGGGKHAEPETIDWIPDAYLINCNEEEKLVIVRKFTKINPQNH